MLWDLTHNRIVELSVTEGFRRALETSLLPKLRDKFGSAVVGIQMYEDYLSDGFTQDGRWFYPLTVLLDGFHTTEWIFWEVTADAFAGGNPYAYLGEDPLEISLAADVPAEFSARLEGRNRYFDGSALKIEVVTPNQNPTFLCGKYSQTFIDRMAESLTRAIEEEFSVVGLSASGITLQMPFAPGTYMDHVSETTAYRRLLMTDGLRTVRDFWVKWETSPAGVVTFFLGEDVPQKIREKEFRFLVREDPERYRNAMGKKNATEWRDIPKRAVKKGTLLQVGRPAAETVTKVTVAEPAPAAEPVSAFAPAAPAQVEDDAIVEKLKELLDAPAAEPEPAPEPAPAEDDEFARAMAFAREALGRAPELAPETETTPEPEPIEEIEEPEEIEEAAEPEPIEEPEEVEEPEEIEEAAEPEPVKEPEPAPRQTDIFTANPAPVFEKTEPKPVPDEEAIRAQIRADLEREYRERENARIEADARRAVEIGRQNEEARRLEEEERARAEAIVSGQRELLEEKQRKMEEEMRALEVAKKANEEEALRLRELANRLKAEEEARAEETRERERLAAEEALRAREAEEQARIAEAARKAEEEKRAEEERRLLEETRLREMSVQMQSLAVERSGMEPSVAPKAPAPDENVTYMHRTLHVLFRHPVDGGINGSIRSLLGAAVAEAGKEDVYISVRSSVIGEREVLLDFLAIPVTEYDLLIAMIRKIGNSSLGVYKVILDEDHASGL